VSSTESQRGIIITQVFSGVGMGLLVGIIVGLSVSPVVKTILGALAGLLAAFLGLQDSFYSKQQEEDATKVYDRIKMSSIRAGSFGLACAVGILFGVFVRTHDLLTITIKDQVQRWVDAGYNDDYARALVVYQKFKILPDSGKFKIDTRVAEAGETIDPASGFLFSKQDMQNYCRDLSLDKYKGNVETRLEAYDVMKPEIRNFAADIRNIPEVSRATIINSVVNLICFLGNSEINLEDFCQSLNNKIDYNNIQQTLETLTSSEHFELAVLAKDILMNVPKDEHKRSLMKSIMEVICPSKQ
jgi:hypothetical protein